MTAPFFYKSGSSSSVVLAGRNAAQSKVFTSGKDGRTYTSFALVTAETYVKAGESKRVEHTVPVYAEGALEIPAGVVVLVTGEIGTAVVVPKSETNKFGVSQLFVRDPKVEILAGAPDGFCGINKAEIVGRVGSIRPIKTAALSGAAVSLAVSRSVRSEDGGWMEQTDWCECTVWGKRAENLLSKAGKGDILLVKGRLGTSFRKAGDAQKNLLGFLMEDFNVLSRKAAPASASPAPAQVSGEECPVF